MDCGDGFGGAVAIQGDTAVIGAPLDTTKHLIRMRMGSAYVFTRSGPTWSLQQKLLLPTDDAEGADGFGSSVAMSGNTVLIGAPLQGISSAAPNVEASISSSATEVPGLFSSGCERPGRTEPPRTASAGALRSRVTTRGLEFRDDTATLADVGSAYSFIRSGNT
ncbi:FG-GAP repeat protein [Myxococcus landrumensis]|uniref:FG-GAP repeat protein n=1 Tax=Myxococcus landrumensis TaxID=2813577 RepID=A0ABX7N053_9BACT|nr:FG-GAP repeat protein [Myxococcus landrumus]